MSKISKLAGETALYGLGSIVPRFLNFMLFPLHTRVFNPEDYGVVSYLYVFVAFLNIVYTFGMETAYFRYATKEGNDPKRIFNIAQTTVAVLSLALSGTFILLAGPIANSLSIPGKEHYIIWLALIMFIDGVVALPFARLRLEKKPLKFAFARIVNVLILIGLNLYFFVIADWLVEGSISFDIKRLTDAAATGNRYGIEYVFLANLIANAFYLVFFIKIWAKWRPVFDKAIFPSMLRYAYPVMLTGLAGMTNEMFSRWTLEWWLPDNFYAGKSSMYAIGVFSAAYKYAVIMNLAIQAFRFAAEPFFFSNASDKNSPALFAKVNHFFVITTSFILLSVTINIDVLKFLVGGEAYYEGLVTVPILLAGYLFLGVYYNFSIWFKLTDKTYFGTLITAGGALATIVLNFALIPYWGYVGSSWASLACYLGMAVACYLFGQKYYPIPYPVLAGLGYILFALALIALSHSITIANQGLATLFHITVMVAFALTAYLLERKKFNRQNLSNFPTPNSK
ncbi:MAG: oligosaccharide flippase family protein [Cyclobacteriaceae bacterium]|nr:oligosaccharide flippase family protein [Cyclobacteriaceae bacterium]MCB0500257.1 oligosaccharide flippase family protein [Cyclobacteriaceae bacterium]MCB9237322.1 oligosaccharide flippase family protein [Flammeovirgaceae bacterium]MCO5271032.1 oligosaccharide flippase family protein [Cyclobacteriaceae bacterium]MCW5903409.1 oligosaccharide flippase family protein [Cyclobacteriaceae bacterium]